jgi:hypothetical protein
MISLSASVFRVLLHNCVLLGVFFKNSWFHERYVVCSLFQMLVEKRWLFLLCLPLFISKDQLWFWLPSCVCSFESVSPRTSLHARYSAMQVVIGHIAFKGEMANFDLSYLRHRWPDQHQNLHGWLRRGYDETIPKWCWSHTRGGGVYTDMQHITKSFRFFFRFYFHQGTHSPNGWSDFDG